jgi:hypothetical protein
MNQGLTVLKFTVNNVVSSFSLFGIEIPAEALFTRHCLRFLPPRSIFVDPSE